MCEVVVGKFQSQNLEDYNMPRFFPTLKKLTEVSTLAASGGIFFCNRPYVVHTKIFV